MKKKIPKPAEKEATPASTITDRNKKNQPLFRLMDAGTELARETKREALERFNPTVKEIGRIENEWHIECYLLVPLQALYDKNEFGLVTKLIDVILSAHGKYERVDALLEVAVWLTKAGLKDDARPILSHANAAAPNIDKIVRIARRLAMEGLLEEAKGVFEYAIRKARREKDTCKREKVLEEIQTAMGSEGIPCELP